MTALRILAIAQQTLTEARRNKIFYSIFLFALVVVLNSYLFSEVTITTLDRVVKDTGLAAINVFALALTVFTGIGVINREIDKKNIFSIISKPIGRWEFIVGKYLGLLAMMVSTCGMMFVCLLFALWTFKTPITASIALGGLGVFLETAVLGAFALLCSTFTNSFVSAFMTIALFVSGHLSAELYRYALKSSSDVIHYVGQAIYYVVPNLQRFNFKYQVTYDILVPAKIVGMSVLYGLGYIVAFLVAAVLVFSRRDFR